MFRKIKLLSIVIAMITLVDAGRHLRAFTAHVNNNSRDQISVAIRSGSQKTHEHADIPPGGQWTSRRDYPHCDGCNFQVWQHNGGNFINEAFDHAFNVTCKHAYSEGKWGPKCYEERGSWQ